MPDFSSIAGMFINYSIVPYIIVGIFSITLLNTAGAAASRRFNFNYGLLSPVSFAIYTIVGYFISKSNPIDIAICCNILVAMFDATAGWYLAAKLNVNIGGAEEQLIEMTEEKRMIAATLIASVFGVIAYMMVHHITI